MYRIPSVRGSSGAFLAGFTQRPNFQVLWRCCDLVGAVNLVKLSYYDALWTTFMEQVVHSWVVGMAFMDA